MADVMKIPQGPIFKVAPVLNASFHDGISEAGLSRHWRDWPSASRLCRSCGFPVVPSISDTCQKCMSKCTSMQGVQTSHERWILPEERLRLERPSMVERQMGPTAAVHPTVYFDHQKRDTYLGGFTGETKLGKRKADEMDTSSLGSTISSNTLPHDTGCDQYQTSEDLQDALEEALKQFYEARTASDPHPPYVNFRGTYTIITDPEISHSKRVKLFSMDLRRTVKYPHSNNVLSQPTSSTSWTELFQCDCSRGHIAPPHSASQTPSSSSSTPSPSPSSSQTSTGTSTSKPGQRKQSSLSHWILNTSKKAKLAAPSYSSPEITMGALTEVDIMPGCGGKVRITAEEDDSHPLAHLFKGQKITIVIEHPTPTRAT